MPQSILKQTPHPAIEDHNHQIAFQHANLIQERKDVELEILGKIDSLIDLPSPGQRDPAHPSSSDLSLVEEALNIFQPSDFDTLIEERNINKRCGYVLCPCPNRLQDTAANFRILQNGRRGSNSLKVVPTRDLEKWCTEQCGRRALWLRVQLAEEPAWERNGSQSRRFMLLDGKPELDAGSAVVALSGKMSNLKLEVERFPLTQAMDGLALERGDKTMSIRPTRGIEVSITESPISREQAEAPNSMDSYNSVEGHKPKTTDDPLRRSFTDSSKDMLNTI